MQVQNMNLLEKQKRYRIMFNTSKKNSLYIFIQLTGNSLHISRSSVGTSDISALLSKESSMYSIISKKKDQSYCTNKFNSTPILEEYSSINSTFNDETHTQYSDHMSMSMTKVDDRLSYLTNELSKQEQIIQQACKALNICKNMKEFVSSSEQIEAERVLLLACKFFCYCSYTFSN